MTRIMEWPEAKRITEDLFVRYGIQGWKVESFENIDVVGRCVYAEKTIYLSVYGLMCRSAVASLNTIKHEVAHAITEGHDHDEYWAKIFRLMGGTGKQVWTEDDFVVDPSTLSLRVSA